MDLKPVSITVRYTGADTQYTHTQYRKTDTHINRANNTVTVQLVRTTYHGGSSWMLDCGL